MNLIAETSAYPLPRIADICAALQGATYFTSMDVTKGFCQIEIHEHDLHKSAFATPFGQFEWTRMPTGFNSSPGAFQHLMTGVLAELMWVNVLVYINDILLFSNT